MRLETAFHPIPPSERLVGRLRARASKLNQSHGDVVGCQISVSAPGHEEVSLTDTGRWKVDVLLTLTQGRRGPRHHAEDRDVYEALSSAFDEAEERLGKAG